MVLLMMFGEVGLIVECIEICVEVIFDKQFDGFVIIVVYLVFRVCVLGVDVQIFEQIVNKVKVGCLVFKVFNVKISLDVSFDG